MIEAARTRRSPAQPLVVAGAALLLAGAAAAALAATSPRERLERLHVRETVLNAEQGRNLNRMARLLGVLQMMRRDPPPALLVSPGDATEAVRAAILVRAITPELQRRAQIHAAEALEIARQRRLAAVASEAVFTADSRAAETAAEEALVLDAARAGLRGYAALNLPEGPPRPPESLQAPAAGPLVRRFGESLPGGGRASGLTILTAQAAEVSSPAQGLVQYVGPVKGWGVILILRMSGGYHLVLAGLDRATAEVGQSVAAGAPLGWMPDGRQSPSELYIEVRERGAPVDPGRWLKVETG